MPHTRKPMVHTRSRNPDRDAALLREWEERHPCASCGAKLTLNLLGNKYGLTRQRVQQVLARQIILRMKAEHSHPQQES